MSLSKKVREKLLNRHCGVINDDDAIDPRHYFFNKRIPKSKNRKALQICRQVSDTLQLVLVNGNEKLDGLHVVDILPAPDSRRLLVIVGLDPAQTVVSATDVEAILAELQNQVPRLRSEISRTINRRRTPQLVFEIAKIS